MALAVVDLVVVVAVPCELSIAKSNEGSGGAAGSEAMRGGDGAVSR